MDDLPSPRTAGVLHSVDFKQTVREVRLALDTVACQGKVAACCCLHALHICIYAYICIPPESYHAQARHSTTLILHPLVAYHNVQCAATTSTGLGVPAALQPQAGEASATFPTACQAATW
jgi:hypothetical protein